MAGDQSTGAGHGPLAGSLAGLGLTVTAADPSADATEMARAETAAAGRTVSHVVAAPEELPFDDGAFAVVYVADTFETRPDLIRAVAFQDVRLAYIRDVRDRFGIAAGAPALVVGGRQPPPDPGCSAR